MKRKILAVLLAASMLGTFGACGSTQTQEEAKTDENATETEDAKGTSFKGVKIEVDIEDSIQGDQNTLDCFNKLIDEFQRYARYVCNTWMGYTSLQ